MVTLLVHLETIQPLRRCADFIQLANPVYSPESLSCVSRLRANRLACPTTPLRCDYFQTVNRFLPRQPRGIGPPSSFRLLHSPPPVPRQPALDQPFTSHDPFVVTYPYFRLILIQASLLESVVSQFLKNQRSPPAALVTSTSRRPLKPSNSCTLIILLSSNIPPLSGFQFLL